MHIKQGTQRGDGLVYYGKNKKGGDVWVTKEKFDHYRDQQKQWRIENKERANELVRNWYKANSEKVKITNKQWREKNPEKVKQNKRRRLDVLKKERESRVLARKEMLRLAKLEREALKEKRKQERVIKKQERELLLSMKPKRVLLTKEEKKNRKRAYYQRPEVKERRRAYHRKPEVKERKRAKRRKRNYTEEQRKNKNEQRKRYLEKHPEQRRKKNIRKVLQTAKKRKTDPLFAFKDRVRNTINKCLSRAGYTKRSKSLDILGCSWDDFYKHIESQFTDGMDWNSRGFNGWHLDHIVPLASATTEEEIIRLNHYTNLQPLWAKDNIEKSDFLPCGNKARNLLIA